MSNQVIRESLPRLKDKKIQIYYAEKDKSSASSNIKYEKHYIYSQEKYNKGGLNAFYQQIVKDESLDGSNVNESVEAKFIINFNQKIRTDMFIEFKNIQTNQVETYGIIGNPDVFEGYKTDITLRCKKIKDNKKYVRVVFDE